MKQLRRHIVFVFGLFSFLCGRAQEFKTEIEGQVYSKNGDVAAVHVSNITRNRGTITDSDGFFSIQAQLNDTLVFSAVQFTKKELVVTLEVLNRKKPEIVLVEALTELNEVVVTPYSLSGYLNRDTKNIETVPIVTTSSLGLLNTIKGVKPKGVGAMINTGMFTKLASGHDTLSLKPKMFFIVDFHKAYKQISGETRKLDEITRKENARGKVENVRRFFTDSILVKELEIPIDKINEFISFCESDRLYYEVVASTDTVKIWELLKRNSILYGKENPLD